jgi:hypothetical protein
MASKIKDLSEKTFGYFKVIKFTGTFYGTNAIWECACKCGKIVKIRGGSLTSGQTKSCGCYRDQVSKENNSLEFKKASFNNIFSRYKREAKNRKFSWELSEEEFKKITSLNCHYCGTEPINCNSNEKLNGNYVYNGIDRVDNKNGYFIGNVVPCCKICNRIKYKESAEDFLKYIDRVYNFQQSKLCLEQKAGFDLQNQKTICK